MCEENWKDCVDWMTRVGLLPPEHRANSPQATIKDLAYTLRDGVQLCRLLSLLHSSALDLKDISQRPQMAQFLCLRNIRTFLQVSKNVFDLKDTDLFQPSMLFDLSDFGKVLYTLSKLSNSPKALQSSGIEGFSAQPGRAPILDEETCQNLEDLASHPDEPTFEEDYYSVVVQTEEDIYQDLCYIDRQTHKPPVTLREKRDYVKGELLETEGNYIEALNMLKKKFMKPLSSLMKEDDKKVIFFGIKELSEIHTGFLSDLNRVLASSGSVNSVVAAYAYGTSKNLGDIFVLWKEKFVVYGDYCANLTRAQNLVEELCSKNELINQEIARAEKEANGGRFKLRDLLSVPMQRVLKYHLLLQKLLDETSWEQHGHDEYKSIERARDAMHDVAEFTNEVKRDSETLLIIRQIEGSIYDLKMPDGMELKDYGRLQKDGELRIRGHDDNRLKSRYVFVFDKVMLMCKTTRMMDKLLRGEQYSYKHSLCLQEYRVEDAPTTLRKSDTKQKWSYSWNLVHVKGLNVYTMYAQTEEQKRRWIRAIEDALINIQPEECRRSDHLLTMHTFEKGVACTHCQRFMKGLFYQGYKCVRCDINAHKECINGLRQCGVQTQTVRPPELPPRPPLLPLVNLGVNQEAVPSPTFPLPPPSPAQTSSPPLPLPLNNINSPGTSNGMRNRAEGLALLTFPHSQGNHHYVNLNHLESFPWYGGEMDRDFATGLLDRQANGTFLVRVRPQGGNDANYALSLKWNDQVKHMKILVTADEKLFYLSESRYFKSIVELVNWYQHNSLAESFSGLDACLERPFERLELPRSPSVNSHHFGAPEHPLLTRISGTSS